MARPSWAEKLFSRAPFRVTVIFHIFSLHFFDSINNFKIYFCSYQFPMHSFEFLSYFSSKKSKNISTPSFISLVQLHLKIYHKITSQFITLIAAERDPDKSVTARAFVFVRPAPSLASPLLISSGASASLTLFLTHFPSTGPGAGEREKDAMLVS